MAAPRRSLTLGGTDGVFACPEPEQNHHPCQGRWWLRTEKAADGAKRACLTGGRRVAYT